MRDCLQPQPVQLVAAAIVGSRRCGRLIRFARMQGDAIDRAGRDAQLTAVAVTVENRVQVVVRADNRIDRAGRQATRTADTGGGVDACDAIGLLLCAGRVERQRLDLQQLRQGMDAGGASRWAAVDGRRVSSDGFGVRAAAGITAACALRLG